MKRKRQKISDLYMYCENRFCNSISLIFFGTYFYIPDSILYSRNFLVHYDDPFREYEIKLLRIYLMTYYKQNNLVIHTMITNTIPSKNCKRRSKRKNKDSKHSIFYLDQPQMATTAKNDLLSQALWNEDNKSMLIFTQPNKYMEQFNNTYDSWHGQKHINIKKFDNKIIEKFNQDKGKTTSRILTSTENRRATKSVGSVQLRRSYRNAETPLKKKSQFVNKSGLALKNKFIHIIPKLQSHSSFRSIKQANSNSKRHKSAKTSLVDFKSNQKKILLEAKVNYQEKAIEPNDEIMRKNIIIPENFLNQKSSKGVLGTTLKQKRNKKMSWLHMKKSSNQTRMNKFTATNSPINKQLNKIINLLQSQNNFNCF